MHENSFCASCLSRRWGRSGSSNAAVALAIGTIAVVGAAVLALTALPRGSGKPAADELTLFCAAGLRQPVEQIVADYQREYQVAVRVQYGGSNTLLGQIEAGGVGDLYLAGEETYAEVARDKGLAREVLPIAVQRPVIAVERGNPKKITGLDDLLRDDVRVALANPDQAAIGRLTRQLLESTGTWARLADQVTQRGVFKPTVSDLANDLKLGTVDATILWDATVAQYPELEAISSSDLQSAGARVVVCVLTSARQPTAALRFARYLTAKDRGLPAFKAKGYEVVDGDRWAESPEVTFFVGSVNRRAIEDTVKAFQEREGVTVNTVYNGCGILTAQMKTVRDQQSGGFPDLYMACDVYYLENVKEWFQEAAEVSDNQIVMVVEKGNPKGIRELRDLLRPGVRVVVGQPEQCTIGALTRRLLENEGVYDGVMKNVVSQTATSAMLVPAVTTGSADVALAYDTDAKSESGRIEMVRIDSPYTKAIQPFAIARSSEHKELARRLFQAIAATREKFEAAGFGWRMVCPAPGFEDSAKP